MICNLSVSASNLCCQWLHTLVLMMAVPLHNCMSSIMQLGFLFLKRFHQKTNITLTDLMKSILNSFKITLNEYLNKLMCKYQANCWHILVLGHFLQLFTISWISEKHLQDGFQACWKPTIHLKDSEFFQLLENHYLIECEAPCAHNVTYNEICIHHFEYKLKNQRMEWKQPDHQCRKIQQTVTEQGYAYNFLEHDTPHKIINSQYYTNLLKNMVSLHYSARVKRQKFCCRIMPVLMLLKQLIVQSSGWAAKYWLICL
jgi:hypothetical protein